MKNKKALISPVGLKGKQVNERMLDLMGISKINESKSSVVVELTKMGPDGVAYAIIRENHEYYIKSTTKTENIVAEDFQYIGGLKNKKSEAYPSYAKAIKHLNLKFNSLNEAYDKNDTVNIFEDDNLLSEDTAAVAGFSEMKGNGFSGEGNLEGNTPLQTEEAVEEDCELTEEEKAVEEMVEGPEVVVQSNDDSVEPSGKPWEQVDESKKAKKLSILRAVEEMDTIIENLSGEPVKKSIHSEVNEDVKYKLKLDGPEPVPAETEPTEEIPTDIPTDDVDPSNDKPFDDEPFDAGVEADEDSDPKTYIEQLSGKLGQSLRQYSESLGEPDFDLEKFAINSVISATHTSQMDEQDQGDIIEKVKTAGNSSERDSVIDDEGEETVDDVEVDDVDVDADVDIEGDITENTGDFLIEPKKSSIFAPKGSKEYEEMIKNKLHDKVNESLNQEPEVEPAVKPVRTPVRTPSPKPTTKPSRRNKPFSPTPSVSPDPKAVKEAKPEAPVSTDVKSVARELASISKNINDMIAKQGDFFKNQKIGNGEEVSQIISHTAELIKNR